MDFSRPTSDTDVQALRVQLLSLPDGTRLRSRGRDRVSDSWDPGYCIKHGQTLELTYDSGDHESLHINRIHFKTLVQVCLDDLDQTREDPSPFLQVSSPDEVDALRRYLLSQADGATFQCRARDKAGDLWDHGVCVKSGDRLCFTYHDGQVENLAIGRINFRKLVQLQLSREFLNSALPEPQPEPDAGPSVGGTCPALPQFHELSPAGVSSGQRGAGLPEAGFFQASFDDGSITRLRAYLHELEDGTCLSCRGRDAAGGKWDYGYFAKVGRLLQFFYESGDREVLAIDRINFQSLVHVGIASSALAGVSPSPRAVGVAVIAHGFCPDTGPDYQLIGTLVRAASARGLRTVVPDFRHSYRLGRGQARDERVRILRAELLRLGQVPFIALAGHSQGGRASACVCTDGEVLALPLRGCLLLGSEDPCELGRQRPQVLHVRIVHAAGDGVISADALRRRAELWHVPFLELRSSTARRAAKDAWGDDLNHDFIAPDLLPQVIEIYDTFLSDCTCE